MLTAISKGFTLKELIVIFFILTTAIVLVISMLQIPLEAYRKDMCKLNLDQIGKSLKLYSIDFGRSINYPEKNGAGFLTQLYSDGILLESSSYLCPSTADTNDGIDLGKITNSDKNNQNYISYSGRMNATVKKYPAIFKPVSDDVVTSLAADDTQGNSNHKNHINFLFLGGVIGGNCKSKFNSCINDIAKDHNWSKKSYYLDPLSN